MATPRRLKEITIHTLNRKLNVILVLWVILLSLFVMSQAIMLGNMNQSYQRLLSVIDVTSKVAENAVTDATTAVATTAAVNQVMCQPLTPIITAPAMGQIPLKDKK